MSRLHAVDRRKHNRYIRDLSYTTLLQVYVFFAFSSCRQFEYESRCELYELSHVIKGETFDFDGIAARMDVPSVRVFKCCLCKESKVTCQIYSVSWHPARSSRCRSAHRLRKRLERQS